MNKVQSFVLSAVCAMLAGCQSPGMEMPLGDERSPEQMGLKIEFNPGFVARGILGSIPTHFGRTYAAEGFLEFRVATVKNEGDEEIEFFPVFTLPSGSSALELHLRMWTVIPRHIGEFNLLGEQGWGPASDPGDSLANYRSEFVVEETKLAFESGPSVPFPSDWGKVIDPRGVRIRAGETAEIRWVLRLRDETPILPGASPPAGFGGMERPGTGYFPKGVELLPAANMRVECLIAYSWSIAPGQSFAARPAGGGEIHPLLVDARFRRRYEFVEDSMARKMDREAKVNLPLRAVRYQISGLPILL